MDKQDQIGGDENLLSAFLAGRDVPCPVCGYNLRGAPSNACPECGGILGLRIEVRDLSIRAWLAALLVVALPLGLYATMTGGSMVSMIFDAPSRHAMPIMIMFGYASVVHAVALWWLTARRRKFWKRSPLKQRKLAYYFVVGAALLFANVIVFLLKVAPYSL